MLIRWIGLLGLVAALCGCAATPPLTAQPHKVWNGGIWNSVLGYHGPDSAMEVNAP